MRIYLSCLAAKVAEERLDITQIGASLKEMCAKTVAQRMDSGMFDQVASDPPAKAMLTLATKGGPRAHQKSKIVNRKSLLDLRMLIADF